MVNIDYKMKSQINCRKVNSFTLTEVLVVLVIIGILILLALPNLLPLVTKAKTTEAKIQLEHVYTLERSYFFENSKYTSDLSQLNYDQQKLSTDTKDGRANYRIQIIQAAGNTFIARATAVVDFDGDGIFNIWEINQDKKLTEVTPD